MRKLIALALIALAVVAIGGVAASSLLSSQPAHACQAGVDRNHE